MDMETVKSHAALVIYDSKWHEYVQTLDVYDIIRALFVLFRHLLHRVNFQDGILSENSDYN